MKKTRIADRAMYIVLFNGRVHEDAVCLDWGIDGPIIGPFQAVTMSYMNNLRVYPAAFHGAPEDEDLGEIYEPIWLETINDLICYDNILYGDVTILSGEQLKAEGYEMDRVEVFDPKKNTQPIYRRVIEDL